MMPKTKMVKKGYDSSGNNFIALGSRKNNDSSTISAANALDSAFSSVSSSSNQIKIQNSNSNTVIQEPPLNKNGSKISNSSSNNNISNAPNSTSYLDPKTIKEEIIKALEKEESPEKAIKIIKLIVVNLKSPNMTNNGSGLSKQHHNQQQSSQQPDLNYLMALSYVAIKKPQLLLKNSALVDFICTSLLFTSKLSQQDKLGSSSSSVLKSKLIRPTVSPQPGFNVQPTICNILYSVFEDETCWPEIFIKAYFDDSLGERTWVDNPSCKEFVQNIMTAFNTRPIPFSADNNNINSMSLSGGSANETSMSTNEAQCEQISLALIDNSCRKGLVIPRYASIRNEIEVHLVDLIRSQLNSKHQQANQRILGQTNSIMQSSSNMIDNRNFLKLLQSTCGFGEVRALALSKLEGWLVNPKLTPHALDLLLSICVNCSQGDQADKDLIAQIIKFKPKIKQQQHYFDCIRELIKMNTINFETLMQLTVMNELTLQQQYLMQHQSQQQQQPPPRNQHNLNLLQNTFATDSLLASKTFAQTMQQILLQRNSDDYLRLLRSLLRDTIRNSRQDFDLLKFTNELINDELIKKFYGQQENQQCHSILFNLAGGLADFNQIQIRERYTNGICDLITVCILVAITPPIKESYLRRQHDTKEILIKYYLCMSQIQSDTVTWLQSSVVNIYKISPTELIRCMFKVLFMVDKPEQCYTIDNWPSEQERGTMFRVVSEIPVLSETLHQVLKITKSFPDNMFMLMLCVEENLLKIAALVHNRDIYSLKLNQMDQFIQSLFSICQYTYQNSPNVPLAITALYWRAWQILLIITALDPKGFGLVAWEKYPTLRLMMEMVMTDNYTYPPQSSITDEMSVEQFHNFEIQASYYEKQEILDFENCFELKQGSKIIRTEENSKLIGQVMKFDPIGSPRQPPHETIQQMRKLNSEYKLGQLLCKSRDPDFLLKLIKRQSSELSLPWLSTMIESSSDCLEIMPVQCICEFVWNFLINSVEELPLKKQINIEQLVQRLKLILTTEKTSDSYTMQQINDIFDYFLNKLCSDKIATRTGALKILYKLFISTNSSSHILVSQQLATSLQQSIDLIHLINVIKELSTFSTHIKPLFIKYFRKALMVETNSSYLGAYLTFLLEHTINNYRQQYELDNSLKMQMDEIDSKPEININKAFNDEFNQISMDLSDFFFRREFCFYSIKESSSSDQILKLASCLAKFAQIIISLNEYQLNDEAEASQQSEKMTHLNINALLKVKPAFNRSDLEMNSYLLIEITPKIYQYIHEKNFNLVVYMIMLINELLEEIKGEDLVLDNEILALFRDIFYKRKLFSKGDSFNQENYLNCTFKTALNAQVTDKILRSAQNLVNGHMQLSSVETDENLTSSSIQILISHRITRFLIQSIGDNSNANNLNDLFDLLLNKFGMSSITIYFIFDKIELIVKENIPVDFFTNFCDSRKLSLKNFIDILQSLLKKFKTDQKPGSVILEKIDEMKSRQNGHAPSSLANSTDEPMLIDDALEDSRLHAFPAVFNNDYTKKLKLESSSKSTDIKSDDLIKQNEYSMICLENIQSQINEIKNRSKKTELNSMEVIYEDISQSSDINSVAIGSLEQIINSSGQLELEHNMNKSLDKFCSDNERIKALAHTILKLENQTTTVENSDKHLKLEKTSRCIIDMLLYYFCHIDPQIVDKEIDIEHKLLFEMRISNDFRSTLTQPYLLSLFIHQANWKKLFDCVQYLFSSDVKVENINSSLNPTIVLDFLSSLLYIPELWKGTESKSRKEIDEEDILTLDEKQICQLLNFIIKELCLLCEIDLKKFSESNKGLTKSELLEYIANKFDHLSVLKFKLNERVQLLNNFLKNPHLKTESVVQSIIANLEVQKKSDFIEDCFNDADFLQMNMKMKLFGRIQNLLLYYIYLEENSIIEYISNSNRIFSELYSKIDIPTSLDVKAHNLLNCFGEIEVNYSQNATSSGTIGVSSIALNYKKKEKEEVVMYAKKQEAFMMDANLLCIKLASTHPFIFIRQIPMMEGLLQGRVVYSFDEFKRRKFDKLFHYIIDLLTVLVPYVFKYEYFKYIESIVSHYFDVFKSYCTENRDANGSLVQKFFDFFEKFVNTDIQAIYDLIVKKHSSFITYMYKLYPDISSLKFINGTLSIPFDSAQKNHETNNNVEIGLLSSLSSVNIFNQKANVTNWSSKQLEPFTSKLINRNNYDGVLSVLQELDAVSLRQPKILSYFVFYLQPFMQDSNDNLRDISIALIMRYLRSNPKETSYFFQSFIECLINANSKIYASIIKVFPDYIILCSEKSNTLLKYALKGAARHNIDISKTLTDAIRLLSLEKYVY